MIWGQSDWLIVRAEQHVVQEGLSASGVWAADGVQRTSAPPPTRQFAVGRTGYTGKRPAEVELFVRNMGSIQREDSAF